MNRDLESFFDTLKLNSVTTEYLPDWVADLAFASINEGNVTEILKLLARAEGGANLKFWEMINEAPTTAKGWKELHCIGSGIDPEQYKKTHRRVVEIVRKQQDPIQ
ncbi:hypothetical protein [Corallincola spongiicola]|uniref:Uncharacterized protein n=1 Tax=Corallincola spongiicola TaxID=2520508 RepID=A0ABY1WUI4_9GAMM|nr:hypothetical protein [Corallincola spongiicola]TAA48414.1 hypothetical protein EXY25_04105 [Corallincola spongiicola]